MYAEKNNILIFKTMTNRRDFLKSASVVALAGVAGSSLITACGTTAEAAPAKKTFLGLQTYSLGNELSEDVPGGLARLKQMGYTDLELAGYGNGTINGVDCAEYKKMADDAGLKITSSHLSPSIWLYSPSRFEKFDDFWKQAAEDHVKLGVKYMVQPSMPNVATLDDAKNVGDVFNRAGAIAKDAGITWGYHNHSGEFKRVASKEELAAAESAQAQMMQQMQSMMGTGGDPEEQAAMIASMTAMMSGMGGGAGKPIEQLFIENTDPALVTFELDVYWAMMGQQDPCEWLTKYPDRYKLLHIKDRWIIGASGLLNFENIFKTAYGIGISEYFVELESGGNGRPQFEGVEESAKYLLAAPFVK